MIKRYFDTHNSEELKMTESHFCCDFCSAKENEGDFDAMQYAIMIMTDININGNILCIILFYDDVRLIKLT